MPGSPDNDDALTRAYEAMNRGEHAHAFRSFTELSRDGTGQARLYLGWMYQRGLGLTSDLDMAEQCYRSVASSGSDRGQYYLASLLRSRGRLAEALEWYERAAAQQLSSASYWAGVMYRDGDGVKRDAAKSEEYLSRAASLGHHFAKRDLARDALRHSKGPTQFVRALAAYLRTLLRGSLAAFWNADDLELR